MPKLPITPPKNISYLLERAEQIAGLTLGELGDAANIDVPPHFKQHKGFTGQLIELWFRQEFFEGLPLWSVVRQWLYSD